MKQERIMVGRHWMDLNSEQYRATVRTRYRRLLVRRGVPVMFVCAARTVEDLRALARMIKK